MSNLEQKVEAVMRLCVSDNERDRDRIRDEIRQYLAGNLCRCSGYEGQLRGIRSYLDSRGARHEKV